MGSGGIICLAIYSNLAAAGVLPETSYLRMVIVIYITGIFIFTKKTFIEVQKEYHLIPKLTIQINRVSPEAILKDGDIVFVDASEDDNGTSRHLVISNPTDIPFISGLHTIVAKSNNHTLDNLFKRYCFQSLEIKKQFRFFSVGTKVSGINKSNIVKLHLSAPPSPNNKP